MSLKSSGILETGRRLLTLLDKQTKRRSVLILFLLIISAGLEAIGVGLVFPLVSMIVRSDGLPEGFGFIQPFTDKMSSGDLILYGALGVFSVFLLKNLLLLGILFIQST